MGKRKRNESFRRTSEPVGPHDKNGSRTKRHKRRYRKEKFWIEDCPALRSPPRQPCQVTVVLTGVDLVDNHFRLKAEPETGAKEKSEQSVHDDDASTLVSHAKLPPTTTKTKTEDFHHGETAQTNIDPLAASPAVEKKEDCGDAMEDSSPYQRTEKIYESSIQNRGLSNKVPTGDAANAAGKQQEGEVESSICIIRCWPDAKSNFVSSALEGKYVPLPNGDCGDGIINPFDKKEVADKYWAQRHRFFSRFDEGIQLDPESWFSVTPAKIADHIANRLIQVQFDDLLSAAASSHFTSATGKSAEARQGLVVLDVFCGCGGNAIAFAKRPEIALVICVDVDEGKLHKAANNARIYNIPPEKLLLVHANACYVLDQYQNGALKKESSEATTEVRETFGYKLGDISILPKQIHFVFLSPPWGGTDYGNVGPRLFDLNCIHVKDESNIERNGEYIFVQAVNASENKQVVYFLPRNTNGLLMAASALNVGFKGMIEMEQNLINGKFKTITAYFRAMCGCT